MIRLLVVLGAVGGFAGPARASAPSDLHLADNLAVPALQLVVAEGLALAAIAGADKAPSGVAAGLLVAMPLAVSGSTCFIGRASEHYRGSCWHSMVGTLIGIGSGIVVFGLLRAFPGLNPWPPGPDDTQAFAAGATTVAYVAVVGIPLGSVLGWNLGKAPVPASSDLWTPHPPRLAWWAGSVAVPILTGRF